MRSARRGAAAGAALAALALTGCGGGGTSPSSSGSGHAAAAAQHVTITGNSMLRFAPMSVHVHTGAVRITLQDSGAYPHNLVIPALHVSSPTVTGAPGGSRISFTVTFTHPGRYAFHCQYHASAGMAGAFVVS